MSKKIGTGKRDVREEITNQIISMIEAGEVKGESLFDRTLKFGLPVNFSTGKAYSGVNVLTLVSACIERGFDSNKWVTFAQAQAMGAKVKKGAKSVTGVFYKMLEKSQDAQAIEAGEKAQKIPMLSTFNLFNVSEIEGLEIGQPVVSKFEPIEAAERLLIGSGAQITWGGARAFYRPATDEIYMPTRDRFESAGNCYAVALHELSHWTGHSSRLNRDFSGRFGDAHYAVEELVAELSAAYLCAELGLEGVKLENHASYLQSWLTVLKSDKNAIFTAAAQASKVFDFVMATAAANDSQVAAGAAQTRAA